MNKQDSLFRGIDGHLLSTGLFYSLAKPDEGNPLVDLPYRVPPYPGEDFLKKIPPDSVDMVVNLVPGDRSTGTVFIAAHPTNALTDTTNFPLILQARDIPPDRYSVQAANQQFKMFNRTNVGLFGMDERVGFPQVRVEIRRF